MGTLRLLVALALSSLVTAGGLQDTASMASISTSSCTTNSSTAFTIRHFKLRYAFVHLLACFVHRELVLHEQLDLHHDILTRFTPFDRFGFIYFSYHERTFRFGKQQRDYFSFSFNGIQHEHLLVIRTHNQQQHGLVNTINLNLSFLWYNAIWCNDGDQFVKPDQQFRVHGKHHKHFVKHHLRQLDYLDLGFREHCQPDLCEPHQHLSQCLKRVVKQQEQLSSTASPSSTQISSSEVDSSTGTSLTGITSSVTSSTYGTSASSSVAEISSSSIAPFGNSTTSSSYWTISSTAETSAAASSTTTDLSIFTGNGTGLPLVPSGTVPPTLSPFITVFSTSGTLTTQTLYPQLGGPIINTTGSTGSYTVWQSVTWATTPPSTSASSSSAESSSSEESPTTTAALSTFTGNAPPAESVGPADGIPSPFVTVFPTDGTSTTMTFWPAESPTPSLSVTILPSTTSTMSIWPSISWQTTQPPGITEAPTSATINWSTFSSQAALETSDLSTFTGSDDGPPGFLTITSGPLSPYITIWSENGQPTTQTIWPLFPSAPTSIYTLTWDDTTTTFTTSPINPYVTGSIEDQDQVRNEEEHQLIAIINGLRHCIDILDLGLCEQQVEPLRAWLHWFCGWLHWDCSTYNIDGGGGGGGGGPKGPCAKPNCKINPFDPIGSAKCVVQRAIAAACDILNHDIDGLKIEFPHLEGFSIIFPKLELPPIDLGGGIDPNKPDPPGPDNPDPTIPTPGPTNPTETEPTNSPTGSQSSSPEESCTQTITATNTAVTCSVGPAGPGSNSTTTACSSNTQITRGCSVTPEITTTTIRSCSQTSTVTDAAVNCSQTITGASWTDVSYVCSTTTSLVSGCDVTATTTTTTAVSCPTGPVQPSSNGTTECLVPMCSSDLCGEACDWPPQQNASTNSSLAFRDLSNTFVLSEPEGSDASAFTRFMLQQFSQSKQVPQPMTPWPPKDANDPARWGTTAVFMPFEDHPDSLAVGALFGCTTVVVASRQGAWMSHIWEIPTFAATFIKDFQDPAAQLFTGNGKDASISGLDGYMKPMSSFDPNGDYNIKVWIVTPIDVQYVGKPQPDLEYLRWPQKITTIRDMLKDRLKVTPNIITYTPLTKERRFYNANGEIDKAAVKKELDSTARGKVILQYDPKQVACSKDRNQQAIWRLWVDEENGRKYVDQDMWDADEDQIGEESDDERAAFMRAVNEQCNSCLLSEVEVLSADGTETTCETIPCSSETCGRCDDPPLAGNGTNVTSTNITGNILILPEPQGDDLTDLDAFMVSRAQDAENQDSLVEHDQHPLGDNFHHSSARFVPFDLESRVLAVSGLRGCTSIVVVSQEGAWMSHVWEAPGFRKRINQPWEEIKYQDLSDEEFNDVLTELWDGDDNRPSILPGLGTYTTGDEALRRGAPGLQAFIVSPRPWDDDDANHYKFQAKLDTIKNRIKNDLDIDAKLISYKAVTDFTSVRTANGGIDWEMVTNILKTSALGKVVLQYDPSQVPCTKDNSGEVDQKQQAAWRLWVGGYSRSWQAQDTWEATPDQLDPNERCDPSGIFCSALTCGKCDSDTSDPRAQPPSGADNVMDVVFGNETGLDVIGDLINIRPMAEPDTYDAASYWAFMRQQYDVAYRIVPHSHTPDIYHGTTANYVRFPRGRGMSLALRGLWGCVSVIIISEKGCWMSHIYEHHSFARRQDHFQNVLNELWHGDPNGNFNLPGFGQFVRQNEMFDGNLYDVRTYIVHPISYDELVVFYEDEINALQEWLDGIFHVEERGNFAVPIAYVPYTQFPFFEQNIWPLVRGDSNRMTIWVQSMLFGRILMQYDPQQIPAPPRSRACPQPYDTSMMRLWVDMPPNWVPQIERTWSTGVFPTLNNRPDGPVPFPSLPPNLPDWWQEPEPEPAWGADEGGPMDIDGDDDDDGDPMDVDDDPTRRAIRFAPPAPPVLKERDLFAADAETEPAPACSLEPATVSVAGPLPPDFYTQFSDYFTMTTVPPEVSSAESSLIATMTATSASGPMPTMTNSTITSSMQTSTNSTSAPMTLPSASLSTASATNSSIGQSPSTTMPHTSCSLAPLPIADNGQSLIAPLSGCACDSSLSAEMVTVVGADQTTTWGCAAGITFYTPVQTADHIATSAPQPTNFCKLHVEQAVRNDGDVHVGWSIAMEIFDPFGASVAKTSEDITLDWTETYFTGDLSWQNGPKFEITFGINPVTGVPFTQDEIDAMSDDLSKGKAWSPWLAQLTTTRGNVLSNQWPTDLMVESAPQPYCVAGLWEYPTSNVMDQARELDFYYDCGMPGPSLTTSSTSTSTIPTQACTVEVEQGPYVLADKVGQEYHAGWNVTIKISDASQQILQWLWFSGDHEWFHEYVMAGEDWNDPNNLTVNFAIDPQTKVPWAEEPLKVAFSNWLQDTERTTWWTSWATSFRAGDLTWLANDTTPGILPFCDVGPWKGFWDEPGAKLKRFITCYWDCGQGVPTPTSTIVLPTPTALPPAEDCRLHVIEQVLSTDISTPDSVNATNAGLLNITMDLYGIKDNHHLFTTSFDANGFNARYSDHPTNAGAVWNLQAVFGFDEGNAITGGSYDPAKWADYDALFAMEMSIDGGENWSMQEYLRCQVGGWSSGEVEEKPMRTFECLFDCMGRMMELSGSDMDWDE
ncbi:hypothetical protein PRZ48_008968 [Zasmidium cellare]|uniref:Uncharacterized protein n=1 Tax=Zasmidium cellare TaxID=395010 RepID=A0ABR0EGZ1_ZASCE|nr:hypothetical protein PRZ48_008968 [Zasmidium cellare]